MIERLGEKRVTLVDVEPEQLVDNREWAIVPKKDIP
jgi:hypothetical protein